AAGRYRIEQRCRDGVPRHLATRVAVEHIAPPLQTNLAWQRLARELAHAGDLAVERVEHKEMPPPLRRREQRGEEPVLVGGAHHRLAMRIGVLHRAELRRDGRSMHPCASSFWFTLTSS